MNHLEQFQPTSHIAAFYLTQDAINWIGLAQADKLAWIYAELAGWGV